MKQLLLLAFIFAFYQSFSQDEKFMIQGRLVDANRNPVADAYIVNYRNLEKYSSRNNGVFDAWVLPGDSLIISHISYFRIIVPVYQILKNPEIILNADTVNILQVDVVSGEKTDLEKAKENIENIVFDPRPKTADGYTESERMSDLIKKENRVERAAASSLHYQFSPSKVIGLIADKIERRKKSKQYESTRKRVKKDK